MGYRMGFLSEGMEQFHKVRLWIHLQGGNETGGQGVLHAVSMVCLSHNQQQVGQDHD